MKRPRIYSNPSGNFIKVYSSDTSHKDQATKKEVTYTKEVKFHFQKTNWSYLSNTSN